MTTTKKKPGARMYAATVHLEGFDPAIYDVSTLVIRHDGKDLTGDEVAAAKLALRALRGPAKPPAPKPGARVTTKAVPAKAATKKRVAAKRPSRAR